MSSQYPLQNTDPNSSRYLQHYYAAPGFDSHGNTGEWHIYHDGAKIFIADAPAAPPPPPPPAPVFISQSAQPSSPPPASSFDNRPVTELNGSIGKPGVPPPPPAPPAGLSNRPVTPISGTDIGKGTPPLSSVTGGTEAPSGGHPERPVTPISGTDIGKGTPTLSSVTGGTQAPDTARPVTPISTTDIGKGTPPLSSVTGGTQAPDTSSAGPTHTVAHGDTMWKIAQDHHMSLSQLEALNPQIKHPELIFPGQKISVTGSSSDGGGTPAAASGGANPTATPASIQFPSHSSYPPGAKEVETAVKTELSGWGTGSGNEMSDPAKNVIQAVTKPDTDPLKIKNDKPHTA